MGAAVRHLTGLLMTVEARTRLLVTLSDGRPDDQDGYRGTYGVEDTRRALLEARQGGVYPSCITIDTEALEYLLHLYGPGSFTVVSQVEKLPFRVSDIYRPITR
jgi:nitric oxide reductase NorD protein